MSSKRSISQAFLLCVCALFFCGNTQPLTAEVIACDQPFCLAMPMVRSVAPPLRVTGFIAYRTRGGSEYIQGQVINDSDKPIYNASVMIFGFSGSGQVPQTVPLALQATFPGQLNPFEAGWSGSSRPYPPQFQIVTYSTTSTQTVVPITVINTRRVGTNLVEATFRNETAFTVQNVQAVRGVIFSDPVRIIWDRVYSLYFVATSIAPQSIVTQTFFDGGSLAQGWVISAQGVISP